MRQASVTVKTKGGRRAKESGSGREWLCVAQNESEREREQKRNRPDKQQQPDKPGSQAADARMASGITNLRKKECGSRQVDSKRN
ncbi:hypothetical protein BO82DRAFT_356163 [Aspergillus uvarum CBS 121591]|uniref:Uncharacterized protein n=1 Tax=Aspergillus uvarum CBS 121591 TaxID=1448315 RepID=A0A319C7D3_9EURO|nr:hypothetical protein BO82DRAFT_356163 [Aspergillus uvarum CBS 121591]PYH79739.1 hypothetical protein BO82DRAFT_356163 [Aspergillus uvarum CBS 121591]